MVELLDLVLTFISVAGGALVGSLFMWVMVGPFVLKRAGPKVVQGVLKDTFQITDEELEATKGDMFKAISTKQGATFAQSVYGALGNIVQSAPQDQLESLAKQYGFEGVEDAKSKLGPIVGGLPAAGGINPQVLEQLGSLGSKGKRNPFAGVLDVFTAISALQQLAPGGGNGGVSSVPGLLPGGSGSSVRGYGSSRVSGW